MKVIVDGDACSRLGTIIKICRKDNIELHVFHDIDHELEMDYGEEHIVTMGSNSADYAVLSVCRRGDIVVTRDTGLASMVLSMKIACVNDNGREYLDKDIDNMLADRYMSTLERGSGIKKPVRGKWPKAKKKNFETFFPRMIEREKQKLSEAV